MRRTYVVAVILLASLVGSVGSQGPDYDLIIRHGRVLDGTGNPFVYADVAIRGDQIAAVGDLGRATARRTIDAAGKYVTPGFMDLHTHLERAVLAGHGTLPNFTMQGFTTAVIDADGRTNVWPIAQARAGLEARGAALNLVQMVGHNTVRQMVMGDDFMRAATPDEVDRMRALVRQGMEEGAFGLSAGLEYSPGRWSTEAEVLELAKAVAPYGGFYQAHLRSQGQYPKWQMPSTPARATTYIDTQMFTNIDAVVETINIASIPAMMDHLHPKGPREWGSGRIITQLVDTAWRDGHQVYINQHPYEGYDENIVLIPRWALLKQPVKGLGQYDSNHPDADYTGMLDTLRGHLTDPEVAAEIRRDIAYDMDRQGGADGLLIMEFPDPAIVGKRLGELARERGEDPIDTALWLQYHGFPRPGGVRFRAFAVSLLDIDEFMRQEYTAVSTDRGGDTPQMRQNPFTHPGTFGTATRKLREFVFERGVTTLPFAIRSMTSLPAQILGLHDRGRIGEGLKADLVVFDPGTVRDMATFQEPFQFSEGIEHVLVNGQLVVDAGTPTSAMPGRVLQRQRVSMRSPVPVIPAPRAP